MDSTNFLTAFKLDVDNGLSTLLKKILFEDISLIINEVSRSKFMRSLKPDVFDSTCGIIVNSKLPILVGLKGSSSIIFVNPSDLIAFLSF